LTATRHKSLVPICNRPAIGYLFDWLRDSGVKRIILALGTNNEDLAEAYPAGSLHGVELLLVKETHRLESGGAIRNAVETAGIEDRFVVLNGDILVEFDFRAALSAHIAAGADLTLALYPVEQPAAFGVAAVDESGNVTGFVEKPPRGSEPGNLVNAGVWIFESGIVSEIPPGPVRVEETLFPSLVARGRRVLGYRFEGLWADIGTSQRYLELNQLLLQRAEGSAIESSAKVGEGAEVECSAVGDGCAVGARAVVRGSVLWEGVAIGDKATVVDSILADGVRVGAGAKVEGAVVGQGAVIAPYAVVSRGTVVEGHSRYDAAG
jgi:mannose-1-phosphate guanylyltransferase